MTEDDKTIIKSIAYQAIDDAGLVEEDICKLRHKEVTEVKKRINWVLVTMILFVLTLAGNFIMQYNRATLQAKQVNATEIQELTKSVKSLVKEIQ
jgi:hypothetical protein